MGGWRGTTKRRENEKVVLCGEGWGKRRGEGRVGCQCCQQLYDCKDASQQQNNNKTGGGGTTTKKKTKQPKTCFSRGERKGGK